MDWTLKLLVSTSIILAYFTSIDASEGLAIVTGSVSCDQCKDGLVSLSDFYGMNITLSCVDRSGELEMHKEETTNGMRAHAMRYDGTPDKCHAQVSASMISPLSADHQSSLLGGHSLPSLEHSACSHEIWTKQEYRCHWKLLNPEMKVIVVFGVIAAGPYGTDTTLWGALQGKADPYKTLLREATTALLNSINSVSFKYHPLGVIAGFNFALLGSTSRVMQTALDLQNANSGHGIISCKLKPCK